MRLLRIITVVLSALTLIAGTVIFVSQSEKLEGPTLVCTIDKETAIECQVHTPDEELLKYVSAYDKQDGDISDRIKVVRKRHLVDGKNTTIVQFAVCDNDNNVASIQRMLILSDYHPPRISLSHDLIFQSGHPISVSSYVSANDIIDGDLSQYVKLISTEFTNVQGEYPINVKVSNSMGDGIEMTIKAYVINEDYVSVKVQLKDNNYAHYCRVGEEIDYMSLVEGINNVTNKTYELTDITVESDNVDTSKPGAYDAFYKILDKNTGDIITMTRLLVIVTED